MMDCTDTHFRVLMRQISKKALLYTEMIVANALHHSKCKENLLNFDPIENPIALQIGGDNPTVLAEAASLERSGVTTKSTSMLAVLVQELKQEILELALWLTPIK